jgi:putative transposase
LRSHCGAQRYAYNWGLALVRAVMDQRKAELSYGIPDAGLTPSLNWSAYSLRKRWNASKGEVAPWWGENLKEAYASGLANLARALGNWNASKTGTRRGSRIRFPRFQGKRRGMSCRFTTGAFGLTEGDRRHVKLPRIGLVGTHESTRKLARHVERGTARIRSATVSHRGGRSPPRVAWATRNEPDGNPHQTRTPRAAVPTREDPDHIRANAGIARRRLPETEQAHPCSHFR